MADINPLNASSYYAGVQTAATQTNKSNKKQATTSTSKSKFSQLFNQKTEPSALEKAGYPPEIAEMSIEDAAIFLKDRIDIAGDILANTVNDENVENFKKSVKQFINFVIDNNYQISKKKQNGFSSPMSLFSHFNTQIHPKNPRVQIETINKKLDELTKSMLYNQRDNLNILAKTNEIKGLIIDFLSS